MSRTSIASVRPWPLTSGSIIDYGGVYSCPPQNVFIFSHKFMTFGMYVYFQEMMCRIPILKIVHNYHTSTCPLLQVHKFHLHMTHWRGPHEMAPISMVSSCPKPLCCVHLGSIGVKFKMYSQICLKDHLYLVLFQEKIPGGGGGRNSVNNLGYYHQNFNYFWGTTT